MKSDLRIWGDLRVFLAVLRRGSTLAASKDLGMAQPTVARRIDALEHALSLTLFDRDTRGFQPTGAADRLRPHAEAVEAAVQALEREARRAGRFDDRSIRLTAPRTNFSDNLARALADFTETHPGARFELVASNEVVDLIAGEADVAIRFAHEITDDRLICRRLSEATSSLYASRFYAERHGLPASMDDLGGHAVILYDRGAARRSLDNSLEERVSEEQIVSRVSDPEAMIAAVRAGLGIGSVPTTLARDDGTLIRCFPPPEGTAVSGWLVISPEAWRRPLVKAFVRFFIPRFRSYIGRRP